MRAFRSIILSVACASLFPILASASTPLSSRLRLSGVNNGFASSQAKNSSIAISKVFSSYPRDDVLMFNRRQEFECPPATPLPVSCICIVVVGDNDVDTIQVPRRNTLHNGSLRRLLLRWTTQLRDGRFLL